MSAGVLFALTGLTSLDSGTTVAFSAAALHIISPAGAFLSAPYAESLFSLCNFLGFYVYAISIKELHRGRALRRDSAVILAGAVFGVATVIRSNGILSGSVFLYDVVGTTYSILWHGISCDKVSRVVSLIVGGSLVGVGTLTLQWQAFNLFCKRGATETRPWCQARIPSIYNFVQGHYW